jgi:hypothetical protein
MVAEFSGFGLTSRLGACLANGAAHTAGLAANLFFDAVQGADASDGFGGDGRGVDRVEVATLVPGLNRCKHQTLTCNQLRCPQLCFM